MEMRCYYVPEAQRGVTSRVDQHVTSSYRQVSVTHGAPPRTAPSLDAPVAPGNQPVDSSVAQLSTAQVRVVPGQRQRPGRRPRGDPRPPNSVPEAPRAKRALIEWQRAATIEQVTKRVPSAPVTRRRKRAHGGECMHNCIRVHGDCIHNYSV